MASYVLNIWRPLRTQSLNFGAASAALDNAIGNGVFAVRLFADQDCFISHPHPSPSAATTSDIPLAAKESYFMEVRQGEKLAAIQASASGTLWVTELTK